MHYVSEPVYQNAVEDEFCDHHRLAAGEVIEVFPGEGIVPSSAHSELPKLVCMFEGEPRADAAELVHGEKRRT